MKRLWFLPTIAAVVAILFVGSSWVRQDMQSRKDLDAQIATTEARLTAIEEQLEELERLLEQYGK